MQYINVELNNLILDIVKNEHFKPIPAGIIIKKIKQNNSHYTKNDIHKAIYYLEKNHYLRKNDANKYILEYIKYPSSNIYIEATITNINKSNNAFASYIDPETNEKTSYFIMYNDLKKCLVGDVVIINLLIKEKKYENEVPYARVHKLIKREKLNYTGTFVDNKLYIDDAKFYLVPKFNKYYQLKNNIRVLVHLENIDDNFAYFSLIKEIGAIDATGTDIDAIILNSNFKLNFDTNVIKESLKINYNLTEKDKKIRRDITDRNIISIDPKTSKDMDDAIYCKKLPNGIFLLNVNIADVSYYIKQNSLLDNDAYTKTTSVYLVDRVLPMLHTKLSNDICSLNQNVDRFCLSVDMEIDAHGNLIKYEIFPSIINNKHKLSYDEVNNYFKTKQTTLDNCTKEILDNCYELYKILRNKKTKDGYVELDIKEPKLILNDDGTVKEIITYESGEAQRMIEDFMVICNHAVTLIAIDNKLPFIYRVHDKPELSKLVKLKVELVKLGFLGQDLIDENGTENHILVKLIDLNKNNKNFNLLNVLLLKSMSKAVYSSNNIGHFGLALDTYTHFTSPIRRYVDLLIHRIFWMFIFDKQSYTNSDRAYINEHIDEIADHCSKQEIIAVSLERDVMAYKIAEYYENKIGEVYNATISTITSFGFFVELENCTEGLVSIKSLPDYYVYDENAMILCSKTDKNKFYSLGMQVKVKLIASDKKTRKIDFIVVE